MLKNLGLFYFTTHPVYRCLANLRPLQICRNQWLKVINGSELMALFEPDVIILELPFPGRDVIATLQALDEHYQGVPILVLAAAGQENLIATAVEVGIEEYLIMDPAGNYLQLIEPLLKKLSNRRTPEKIKHANQLAALRQIGLEMAAQLDLNTLLQSIVSKAIKLLNGDAGGLYLLNPDNNMLEWQVAIGPDLAPLGSQLKAGQGVSGTVMATGQAILIANYQEWNNKAVIYSGYTWTALVAVPVKWGDEFLGVLNILSNTQAMFSQSDADLLTLFGSQVAIAIHNAHLFNQEREQRLLAQTLYAEIEKELQERKSTETALWASQERFRAAIEASLDMFFILERLPAGSQPNFQFRIVEINRKALEFLGITNHQDLPAFIEKVPEWLQAELIQKYIQVSQTGVTIEDEIEVVLPGREPIWLQHKVVKVGQLIAVTASDITARKSADEAYRTLVNNSLQGLIITQKTGPVFVNPMAAEIVGIPAGELLQLSARQLFQFFHPDDREAAIQRLRERFAGIPHSPSTQVRLINAQGQQRWLDSHITPVQYRGQIAMQIAFLDVTERKIAEEALFQSQQALLENQHILYQISYAAPIAILIYDLFENRIIFCNQYVIDLLGYPSTIIQHQENSLLLKLIHPQDQPALLQRWQKAEQSGLFGEYRIKNRQGEWRWIQDRHIIFKQTSEGKPKQILIVAQDISERKEIELALRDSEQHYRNLFATARRQAQQLQLLERVGNVIANELDIQKVFQVAGDTVLETFHYARVDIMVIESEQLMVKYQTAWDFASIIPNTVYRGICGRVARSGTPVLIKDVRFDPDYIGPDTILSEICVPLLNQTNKVVGIFNIESYHNQQLDEVDLEIILALARQISIAIEQAQLHTKLQEREKHFRALVENSSDSIVLMNADFQISYASPSVTRLWGYSPETFQTMEPADLVHPDDLPTIVTFLQQVLQSPGQNMFLEHRARYQDGTYRWVQTTSRNLLDEPGIAALVFNSRDVTETRQANEALRRSQRLESLGVMAGSIAHDFNNLLTGLMAEITLAMRSSADQGKMAVHLTRALKVVERAADLTGQMLAYSGKGHFQMIPLQLNEFIEENIPLLQMTMPKIVELQVSLTEGLPMVEADRGQMQQLLMNLVINGAEAHENRPGVVMIRTGKKQLNQETLTEITATRLPPGAYIYLQVIDQGKGMSQETVDRIFDPFFTTKFTGRGLGLAAVLGIVKGHKGSIEVSSKAGRGTIFTILLPVATQVIIPPLPALVEPRPVKISNVLIIDDNEAIRLALGEILALHGIKATLARNGLDGVEKFQEVHGAFDLVLLDLTMPVLSGEETFIRLNQIRPDVTVILLSGYSEEEATRRFAGLGLAGFLKKPFQIETLLSQINLAFQA